MVDVYWQMSRLRQRGGKCAGEREAWRKYSLAETAVTEPQEVFFHTRGTVLPGRAKERRRGGGMEEFSFIHLVARCRQHFFGIAD
jgi:hypothetical protein